MSHRSLISNLLPSRIHSISIASLLIAAAETASAASPFLAAPTDSPLDLCSEISIDPCSVGEGELDTNDANNDYDPGSAGCLPNGAGGRDIALGLFLSAGDQITVVYTAAADGVVYLLADCSDPTGSCVIGSDATGPGEPETLIYVSPIDQQLYLIFDSAGANSGGPMHASYAWICAEPRGACCLPDESCVLVTEASCQGQGGQFFGEWNVCPPSPIFCDRTPTACCLPDGGCVLNTWFDCDQAGGAGFLPGTPCDPDPCVTGPTTGACCTNLNVCFITDRDHCQGPYFGDGSTCEPSPCAPMLGACCLDDHSCVPTTFEDCAGDYQGDGVPCGPDPCGPPPPPSTKGACCFPGNLCVQMEAAECFEFHGNFLGEGTPCDGNHCQPPVPARSTTWGGLKSTYR